VDFSSLFVSLSGHYPSLAAAQEAGAPTINYGVFLNTVLNFLIVAFAVFLQCSASRKLCPSSP
jgi:large conductance mechanosensitive channel